MNEQELRDIIGDELFDRLSQDDKKLILNTAGKFDIMMNEKFNKEVRRISR